MDHLDVELAHRLVAGELSPADTAHWLTHVATCLDCRTILDRERAWSGLMHLGDQAPEPPDAPPDLQVAEVLPPVGRPPVTVGQFAFAVAVLCIAAAALIWQWAQRPAAAVPPTIPEHERHAAAHRHELRVLDNNPWLTTELETIVELDRILRAEN